MPQARITHHPRAASNKANPPEMIKAVASQRLCGQANNPPINNAKPAKARTARPRPSRLRRKKFFMENV